MSVVQCIVVTMRIVQQAVTLFPAAVSLAAETAMTDHAITLLSLQTWFCVYMCDDIHVHRMLSAMG
jgi:hypothetical protein